MTRPQRPLIWPDVVLDLQDLLADIETPLYIVGGAVRDAYLHRPVKDIDLAVPENSIEIARKIANRTQGDIFVMDTTREVARVFIATPDGRLSIDVARFRGADLAADLEDRDFTINAMAVDLHGDLGDLIDPLGGTQDAANKRLRRCTPHAIADDPLRALRAIRQSIQLNSHIEAETLADIRTFGPRLRESSDERIRDEFWNLIGVAKPVSALRILHSLGLLEVILPETAALDSQLWANTLITLGHLHEIMSAISPRRTDNSAASFHLGVLTIQLDRHRPQLQEHLTKLWPNERSHQVLLLLAVLLYPLKDTKTIEARAEALKLSKSEKQWLMSVASIPLSLEMAGDVRLTHGFWHHMGEAGIDVCLLTLAAYIGPPDRAIDHKSWLKLVEQAQQLLEMYYNQYEQVVAPPPVIDTQQLISILELKPGPIIRELLDFIRQEQAAGAVSSAEDALNAARAYLNDSQP